MPTPKTILQAETDLHAAALKFSAKHREYLQARKLPVYSLERGSAALACMRARSELEKAAEALDEALDRFVERHEPPPTSSEGAPGPDFVGVDVEF